MSHSPAQAEEGPSYLGRPGPVCTVPSPHCPPPASPPPRTGTAISLLPQIFHFAKGQPYIDEVGTFKERIQWVGDPRWKDGSIVIHNLDYSDNGTFTCDVKNPPDIVGKTSQVTLYVFEKGARGDEDGLGALGGGRRSSAPADADGRGESG